MRPAPAIGPVADNEIDALVKLMHETIRGIPYYSEAAKLAEYPKHTAAGLRALISADSHSVIVAREGTALVGFCLSRFDDGLIWLTWFGTAASARGRGIGAALLAALAKSLPSRGAHKIWCDSRTDNKESISVLERAGFKRIATLTNHWYNQDYYLWEWYPDGL